MTSWMRHGAWVLAALATTATAATTADEVREWPANTPIEAEFHLWPAQGKTGRDTPAWDNYRPQVHTGVGGDVTCAMKFPGEKIEPGSTQRATLRCLDPLKVRVKQPQIRVTEGGRVVGDGRLLLN
ncbi:hypothetical protein KAK07_22160 [Ideonella sp. 4Y16]|uniref:Uncharacterized protein n=1 Tax=Ideonella alba TaxID=2824118 RepID=A0A941BG09_9BURK|nr:hypothetical protein [Ideonella alba]MBQ0930003.1 hypothetical protein [Ideonella alba]MBQ0946063.1 hypothetical protein [Ideonella alba]